MRQLRLTCLTAVMFAGLAVPASASAYDAVSQFSTSEGNPNGAWSYAGAGELLQSTTPDVCGAKGLPGWTNGGTLPHEALVYANQSAATIKCETNETVYVPAHYIGLDPQANPSVEVLWTAPAAGTYEVIGNFRGIDRKQTSHAVAVLDNGASIYSSTIGAYNEKDTFALSVAAAAGDTVTFRSETNPKEFQYLATGLQATISASPAQPPEYGRCVKVGGKAGRYSNATCTKDIAGSKTEDEFEWSPGPGAENTFTATGGAGVLYETHEGYSGSCTSVKAGGEVLADSDNKHLTAVLEWSGCKVISSPGGAINGASCQSSGRGAGEVVSNPLAGEVGWENKAKKLTALVLEPQTAYGDVFSRWVCAGYSFSDTTHGRGLLVNVKNDAMKTEELLSFKQTRGVQEPDMWHLGEAGEETTFLESNEPVAFGQVGVAFGLTIKRGEKLELNAVV